MAQTFRQELQRDKPAETGILCFINDTHAAPARFLHNAVVRDGSADERVGIRHSAAILGGDLRQVNDRRSNRFYSSAHIRDSPTLLFVVLDDPFGTNFGFLGIVTKLPQSSALP